MLNPYCRCPSGGRFAAGHRKISNKNHTAYRVPDFSDFMPETPQQVYLPRRDATTAIPTAIRMAGKAIRFSGI